MLAVSVIFFAVLPRIRFVYFRFAEYWMLVFKDQLLCVHDYPVAYCAIGEVIVGINADELGMK